MAEKTTMRFVTPAFANISDPNPRQQITSAALPTRRTERFSANRTGATEVFFMTVNVDVTGAARLYRAASVWTAGLGLTRAVGVVTSAATIWPR